MFSSEGARDRNELKMGTQVVSETHCRKHFDVVYCFAALASDHFAGHRTGRVTPYVMYADVSKWERFLMQ